MKNKLLQGLGFNDEVRFFIIDTRELISYTHEINKSSKTAIAALGRSMTITSMMGIMLKGDTDKITTTIDGNGELGKIISYANNKGEIKALISNPYFDLPANELGKVDVKGGVGTEGTIRVIKDIGLKDPFVGEVPIISGELAEDFTYYFSASEQIPTAISAGVLIDTDYSIKSAGGLIVQVMPDASSETIDKLEKAILNLQPITTLLQTLTLEEILDDIFSGEFRVLAEHNIEYKCDCSEDRFVRGIKLLPVADIIDIKKDDTITVNCDFCKKEYKINTDQL